MRKGFVISLMLLLCCTVNVCAAEASYSTAGDLYETWCCDLPDYICGVWSTDGGTANLTFGIQNTTVGNAGKQEILELIEDDSTVTFVYQEFSRNYLLQIQKEIDGYFEKDVGLVSTGLDDMNNCIAVGILKERQDNADTQNMIHEIAEKYGKAVSLEYTDKIVHTLTVDDHGTHTWTSPYAQPTLFLPLVMMAAVLIGAVFLMTARRKMLFLQTAPDAVASVTPLSSKEVEDMVKNSDCNIPSDLKQKVMTAIHNQE